MTDELESRCGLLQQSERALMIHRIDGDDRARVTPNEDVMDCPGVIPPQWSRHEPNLADILETQVCRTAPALFRLHN